MMSMARTMAVVPYSASVQLLFNKEGCMDT